MSLLTLNSDFGMQRKLSVMVSKHTLFRLHVYTHSFIVMYIFFRCRDSYHAVENKYYSRYMILDLSTIISSSLVHVRC